MSSFNEYAPWADVQYTNLTPEEIKAAADAVRGGGGSTTSSATATKVADPVRNQREKYIISSSDSQIATMLKQGIITMDEVKRLLPESRVAKVMDNQVTPAEMAQKFSIPKQDIDSSENPALALQGKSSNDPAFDTARAATTSSRPSVSSGGGAGGSGSPAAAASPAIAGDYVWNNGRPYIAYQGQKYMLPPGVQEDDPRVAAVLQRLGGGNTAGSVTGDSKNDLYLRGATDLGKATVLNGQQYRMAPGSVATQGADGKWYIPGSPTPFTSEAAAKAAMPLVNVGAGLTSRMGNSPTAKAAAGGGFGRTVENPLFNTIGLDQSIAAGVQKGIQGGDILGTISNNSGMPLDITYGGISQGGGLTPVGNPMDPFSSFTGQVPGASVGMSSILGNSGHDTMYWLSQMSGLPPSEVAKLGINSPEKALQFQQAIETARAQGRPVDFAPLYTQSEGAGGLYGGIRGGGIFSNSSTTPFDQSLAGFKDWSLGSPDLTYLPEPSGYGSTQVGNVAYANSGVDEYGMPLTYGKGGAFTLNEPSVVMGLRSRKPYALLAEAGKQEKVTIQPTQEDITMNREMGMGLRPLRGGKPMGFAAGGTIYAGGNKGFVNSSSQPIYAEDGTVTDYGQRIGYKSDAPLIYTGGAMGGENQNFLSPQASRTGEPVPASFEFMGVADKERFANQGNPPPNQRISGPIGPAPVGYQPYGNTVLPVYDQLNPQTYDNLGDITGYRYVPINNGGTPALVRVPEYSFPAATPNDVQRQQSAAFLMALLNGSDTGNMSPGSLGFQGMPDSTNRAAILAKLYDLDPAAWAQAVSAGAAGQNGTDGMGGGLRSSQDIQNEAFRQRYYGIDARNRGRAGMDPATILNIPRVEGWQGEGQAPYQQFNGRVPEGYALPFDYEPGSPWFNRDNSMGGGMGGGLRPPRGGGQNQMPGGFSGWYGGDMRTPEPMGGNSPWGAQLPQWVQNIQPGGLTRYAGRRQRVMQPNSPLGAGLAA